MRTSKLVMFIILVVMLGLLLPHNPRFGFADSKETGLAAPSSAKHSPLDKLDRKALSPIERTECPEKTVAVVPGESGATVSCEFSPDGKFAAGYSNGAIGLWDMTGAAPKQMEVLEAGATSDRVTHIRFSPNGKRFAAIRGTTLQLWDVTGDGAKLLTSWEVGRAQGLAFHPNNKLLVCGQNNAATLYEIDRKGFKALPVELPGANSSYSFSRDGAMFAAVVFNPARNGERYGSEVKIWTVNEKKFSEHALLQQETSIKSVAFSPDGKRLATGSLDNRVRLWDVTAATPKVKSTFDFPKWIRDLHFTPDGAHLVAISSGADIIVWNLAAGKIIQHIPFAPERNSSWAQGAMYRIFSASAMSPDGRHLAFSNYNPKAIVLRLFPATASAPQDVAIDAKEQRRFDGHTQVVYRVAFLPDGKTALSCSFDGTVRRWDLATGRQTAQYRIDLVNDIAVLPDGRKALFARGQSIGTQRITLWDVDKGIEIATWKGHTMAVNRVRTLSDGKTAVTSSGDGTVALWELATGRQLGEFVAWRQGEGDGLAGVKSRQAGGVAIAVTPNGKSLATGAWRTDQIAVWKLKTGRQVRSWPSGHGQINSIEYSPDGHFLLTTTGNHRNAGAQLWDAATGELTREWLVGYLSAARFSPDGKQFLTADLKGSIQLWNVEGQIPQQRFAGHEGLVTDVEFSPDGKSALSSGYDKTVRQWRISD